MISRTDGHSWLSHTASFGKAVLKGSGQLLKPEVDQEGVTARYVWEAEDSLLTSGKLAITIGNLQVNLNLTFLHERRYALGYLFGFRNPQADIDRLILQHYVHRGDVVLDAGANIGVTAAEALACGADHVVCVEPENSLVARLHTVREHCSGRMTIQHCALGACEGYTDLLLSVTHNQGHTISSAMRAQFPSIFADLRQRVHVLTVDDVLEDRPADIWKLDVEGAEADAVRGAKLTLKRFPPRLIIAELYDSFVDEVVTLLTGYRVKRAALTTADYGLRFLDQIGGPLPEAFCPTSPVYVFSRRD